MESFIALIADVGIFVLVPWMLWRLIGKVLPIVVLPILLGMGMAVLHIPVADMGIPSVIGDEIGWVAVLVLAFTAGLEMWQHPGEDTSPHAVPQTSVGRLLAGAAVALGGPLITGSILAYMFFLPLKGWHPPHAAP